MANRIIIKKGLQIPLLGDAQEELRGTVVSELVRVYPEDFHGVKPKLLVNIGDKVKAGTILFHDKDYPTILFASPVSGEISSVVRGEKRRILYVEIKADRDIQYEDYGKKKDISSLSGEEIKNNILNSGIWFLIKQRPYDIIALPDKLPRDIFVTAFDTAPLAPSYPFILKDQIDDLQTGLDVLSKLTSGKLYFSLQAGSSLNRIRPIDNMVITEFKGPHPAGNVGVQINHIKPINKGDVVWTLNAPDVAIIGRLFNSGFVNLTRTVALTGSEIIRTGYYNIVIGSQLKSIFTKNVTEGISLRYISGNPLTGRKIEENGYLRAYDNQITVIPEGDDVHELFGWASLSSKRYSAGCTYPTYNKKYRLDARLMGGPRAIIVSNEYDKVFPMDIFPEQLIKSIIAFNIDKMEQLGIYEVAPEDFALCEFVDTSKLELQYIVRRGLDLLRKEME